MELEAKLHSIKKPIMVLGTSSGAGKSLTVTAICRILKNLGEEPIPFKGQNMSNNAWVDWEGGEMAYSQALQAFACGINPSAEMNPILLKPQGNSISEVIHLGKSIGITTAKNYYKDWFIPGWEVIKKSLSSIYKRSPNCRLILEGAGSPVEMNLIHRDLTNLRVAKYLNASCILVTDIERGGVFAQIIGTLELMKPEEKKLVKGIIINRFRGDLALFEEGKDWIESKTQIPVIAGNCVTYDVAKLLMEAGVAGLMVGIGPGAACTSRGVLGIGIPQATAIADCSSARDDYFKESGLYIPIIGDGGIVTGGDICKCLACGADAVMIGSPIAKSSNAPGKGFHWGMATPSPVLPRGTRIEVGSTGSLERIIKGPALLDDGTHNLLGAIRTSMSTLGAKNIKEMQEVEIVIAPSLLTEGKVYQKAQQLGMGK